MGNEAVVLFQQHKQHETRAKAREALAAAQEHGLAAFAQQIAVLPISRQ